MIIRPPTANELPQLRELLLKYGDIPPYEVDIAISKGGWLVAVENGRIISGGRTEQTDWYETTFKNFFTIPGIRAKGLATELGKRLRKETVKEIPPILKADITSTNVASQGVFRKLGFKPMTQFMWTKSEPSADVWMKVEKKPTREQLRRQKRFSEEQIHAYKQRMIPLDVKPTESIFPSKYLSPKIKKKKSKQSQLDIEQTKQTTLW